VNVQVVANGAASAIEPASVGGRPGIFTTLQSGTGPGVITHGSGELVTASNPAVGSEFLVVYCTGLGRVTNQPPVGTPAPRQPAFRDRGAGDRHHREPVGARDLLGVDTRFRRALLG